MKRSLALCLLTVALLACQGKSGTAPAGGTSAGAVDNVDQLKADNQELRDRNAQLEMVNEQQSQMLAQYTEKLNQILDALDAINGKQNEIDRLMIRGPEGSLVSSRYDIDVLRSPNYELLALQACHPRFFATHRYIVYAKLVTVRPRSGVPYSTGVDTVAAGS